MEQDGTFWCLIGEILIYFEGGWLFKRTFANEFVKRFLKKNLSKVFDTLA